MQELFMRHTCINTTPSLMFLKAVNLIYIEVIPTTGQLLYTDANSNAIYLVTPETGQTTRLPVAQNIVASAVAVDPVTR